VTHSEFNPSRTEPVHFLQIWILPETRGLDPSYEQQAFDREVARAGLVLLAAGRGKAVAGVIPIAQDAAIRAGIVAAGEERMHPLPPGRHAWVHVARGRISLNAVPLQSGDGAGVSDEPELRLTGADPESEVLVFELG
jgi:quercetin 2,3-dioxygenase